jgi:hypothetical protein
LNLISAKNDALCMACFPERMNASRYAWSEKVTSRTGQLRGVQLRYDMIVISPPFFPYDRIQACYGIENLTTD